MHVDSLLALQWCEVRGTDLQSAGALVGSIRNSLTEIGILRARRLSDEALALPPTHFLILGLLSSLILAGFVLASLGSVTIDPGTKTPIPSFESKILFAILTGVYTLFFNFSRFLFFPTLRLIFLSFYLSILEPHVQ